MLVHIYRQDRKPIAGWVRVDGEEPRMFRGWFDLLVILAEILDV